MLGWETKRAIPFSATAAIAQMVLDMPQVISKFQSDQVTESTHQHLKDQFDREPRGTILVQGRGKVAAYLLLGKKVDER